MAELLSLFWSPALPPNVNVAILIWIALGVYGFRLIHREERPRMQARDQAWFAEHHEQHAAHKQQEALESDPPPVPPQIRGRRTP